MGLFTYHSKNIFKANPEMENIPFFDGLSNRQMQFVVLVADSSYQMTRKGAAKKLRLSTANDNSLSIMGKKLVTKQIPEVERAIEYYLLLQNNDSLNALEKYRVYISKYLQTPPTKPADKVRWVAQTRQMMKQGIFSLIEKEKKELIAIRTNKGRIQHPPLEGGEGEEPIFDPDEN